MITTDDRELAARLRRLRHQGMSVSDLERHRANEVVIEEYTEIGFNFRLSDVQAALGVAQLEKLSAFVSRRRSLARTYDRALAQVDGLVTPFVPSDCEPNYQSYIVRLRGAQRSTRDRLLDELRSRGVASRPGLMAAHLEPCYRDEPRRSSLEHSEAAAAETFLLPMYVGLEGEDQAWVIEQLREALGALGPLVPPGPTGPPRAATPGRGAPS